ncbi:MAG: hypothetical protein AAGA81_19740 [Acidobacteriota bacterium]
MSCPSSPSQLRKQLVAALLLLLLLLSSTTAVAQQESSLFDDLTIESSLMRISKAELDGDEKTPTIYRSFMHAVVGRGPSTLGLLYQYTTRGGDFGGGDPENGLMLTASHDFHLNNFSRLELNARVGLTSTDVYQPLFATDTDLRANLVLFDSVGKGYYGGYSVFPSAYIGTQINSFGRVQGLIGGGAWWKQFGVYLTGFHAFNGDDATGERINFADLDNAGISLTTMARLGRFEVELKRNFIIRNGGNDLTFSVRLRRPFARGER